MTQCIVWLVRLIPWVLLVVGAPGTAMAEEGVETRNKRVIEGAFHAWRQGTGGVFDLLAPDVTWTVVGTTPASKTYRSRQEFIDEAVTPVSNRLSSPLVPTVRGIYADGDVVVAWFDAEATALDGKPYRNTYTWILRLSAGRIVSATALLDTAAFNDLWRRVKPR